MPIFTRRKKKIGKGLITIFPCFLRGKVFHERHQHPARNGGTGPRENEFAVRGGEGRAGCVVRGTQRERERERRVREMNTQWEGGTPLTPGTRQKGVQLRCILVRAALPEGSRPGLLKCRIGMGKKRVPFHCYRGLRSPRNRYNPPPPFLSASLPPRSSVQPSSIPVRASLSLSRSLFSSLSPFSFERDGLIRYSSWKSGGAHGPLHKISLKTPSLDNDTNQPEAAIEATNQGGFDARRQRFLGLIPGMTGRHLAFPRSSGK